MESHSDCVHRIADGDESALEELISSRKAYVKAVFRNMGVRSNGGHTWEDLCQLVWIRVWKAATTFIPGASVSAWLHTIAKNVAIDHMRKQSRANRCAPTIDLIDSVCSYDDQSSDSAEFILNVVRKNGGRKTVEVAEQLLAGRDRDEVMRTTGIQTQATLRWRVGLIRSILEESSEFTSVFCR